MPDEPVLHPSETVPVRDLKPHPRNYRGHPPDQIEHLAQSIREHGIYRNVVIADDNTILAGHGVVIAAANLGLDEIPVIRLPIAADDPKALKILAGDNELGLLAEIDDRGLSEILKEILDTDIDGLFGTGYDEQMLANLLYVTRPAGEIASLDAARHWVGLPEFGDAEGTIDGTLKIVVHFDSEEDRTKFMESIGATVVQKKTLGTWSMWWPEKEKEDLASLRFEE